MAYYYKTVKDGVITQIENLHRQAEGLTPITQEDYSRILNRTKDKPADTLEQKYELKDDTESYEPRETTHAEKVQYFTDSLQTEEITLEDVPEEFREEVQNNLPNNPYGLPDEIYLQIREAEETRIEEEIVKEVQDEY